MVAAAADEHRPVDFIENVPENFRAADTVVHVYAHGSHSYAARFVNEIVANTIAAKGVIAPGVDSAHVSCLQRDVVNVIELNQMVVPGKEDRAMRMIVHLVMRDAQADAA